MKKPSKGIPGTQIFRENQSRFHLPSGYSHLPGRTWKTAGDSSNLKHSPFLANKGKRKIPLK